jgi:L-2-aminoadipate reductase
MVSVNHAARLVVAGAFCPPKDAISVCHLTAHPRVSFNKFASVLEKLGYDVKMTSYDDWREKVKKMVEGNSGKEEFALLPLYDTVVGGLIDATKAPALNDRNAKNSLRADAKNTGEDLSAGSSVTEDLVALYVGYLTAIDFMPKPPKKGQKEIPEVKLTDQQIEAMNKIGGRGLVSK